MRNLTREDLIHLLDKKIFHQISEVADEQGVECYVVGGYVRDLFLERPSQDIDIVTVGSGIALAKALAGRLGRGAHLSVFSNFGTAQVKFKGMEAEIPEHIIEVLGDASALERIFLNLIQNAGRYAQSFLHVFVREQKQQVWICFENDAFNVTEADVEHLFERFYRKDRARTQEGTGLGLTVAKQLAEAMEAKLTAELIREPGGGKGEIIPKLRFTLEMKKVEKFMQKE